MCYLLIHYVGNQCNFNVNSGINNHNYYLSQNDLSGDFLSRPGYIPRSLTPQKEVLKNKSNLNMFLF